jgi:hypothetical protein
MSLDHSRVALVVFRLLVKPVFASSRSISSGESTRTGVRAERSAIPAKGDRGLSGSAMVRSYSQAQRTTRGRIARHLPPTGPGPAGDVQRRTVPRRGWKCWTLEMAESLISKRLLEVISNRPAENGRSPGKPPFPDFQGHFRGHEGGPGRLDVADASLGIGRTFKRGVCSSLSFGNVQSLIDLARLTPGRILMLVPIDQDLRS